MKGVRENFFRYNTADYIKTEATIAAYLEACARGSAQRCGLHAERIGHGGPCAQHEPIGRSHRHGARGTLQGAVGRGNPSLANTMKVAKLLGYRLALVPARD